MGTNRRKCLKFVRCFSFSSQSPFLFKFFPCFKLSNNTKLIADQIQRLGYFFHIPIDETFFYLTETVYEIADLAYHVMVLMVEAGISLEDIHRELASRHVIDHKVKQEKMA